MNPSVRYWWARNKEADMSELERNVYSLSSFLGDLKTPNAMDSKQERRDRGNRSGRQNIMQLEVQAEKGFSSSQGVSLTSNSA